jgi:hypothetical protein
MLAGAAAVTLSGPHSVFGNLSGLTTLARGASFSLLGGRSFTTAGALTNNGLLTLGPGSVLTVGGSFTNGEYGTLTTGLGGTRKKPEIGQVVSTSGQVALSNSLHVYSTVLPPVGSSFELLDNEGNSAIRGTFTLLAELATFTVKAGTKLLTFQITYKGRGADGSQNVVITRIS